MPDPTNEKRRHTGREIGVVKLICRQHAAGLRFVSLGQQLRLVAMPLWREGLVEVFYKQVPERQPALIGPHYSLSAAGRRFAAAIGSYQLTGEITGFGPHLGVSSGGEKAPHG